MKSNGHPILGILEWLRPGEEERVERLLADLKTIGVKDVRTGISWADWHTEGGEKWYEWLLPRLAREVQISAMFSLHSAGAWYYAQRMFAAARSKTIRRFPRRIHHAVRRLF